ncbi:thiosulfate oxidation carrier complex protein SoxZ [Sideroxydans lithotrophicus]|uniref:Sulfur oxidation protein SoxZ n=1 Tax=Sideroxydans lithotrophicus (strain ES-1) TaxID=580332 RepID=D5CSJ5_SIDLE|nr:thiosulfate oxidation carrier complex protein SoxZ [Sideroxydans lithotrophicus]ADE11931.1 Sulfur oxidation protein SoxZ [Sideroxydans lithotrophicus ES-1]
MAEAMKMRATMQGDAVDVKVLIQHIMETGQRKDKKTGNLIPAHFINQVSATLNGKMVLDMQWGVGISRNPFVGFRVKGAKVGDKVAVHAVDNLGTVFDGEVVVA